MFYLYLLHSFKDQDLYIGVSSNPKNRIMEHQHGGSFATKYLDPWRLSYYTAYIVRGEAIFIISAETTA